MKIAIIGQQDFGKAVLEAFLARKDEVAAVFCAPEKEGARPDALRLAAQEKGLKVHQFKSLKAPEAEEEQKDPSSHERFYRGAGTRPNWSRPLPKLLIVSGVTTAATLNDVRVMIERHLPVASRTNEMWRYVFNELREAALGDDAAEFSSVLDMALSLEGLEWA